MSRAVSDRRSGGASFRISTVGDFEPSRPGKRKAGQPPTACQRCRLRKIKCTIAEPLSLPSVQQSPRGGIAGNSAPTHRCQPCQQANLKCQWDGIDRRRKQKARSSRTNDLSPGVKGINENDQSPFPEPSGSPPAETQQEHTAALGRYSNLPELESEVQIPGLTSICEMQFDTSQFQGSQQFLAEFFPGENMDMPQDWPDLQNLVHGLDFISDGDQTAVQKEAARSPGLAPSGQPQGAHGPRLVRLRYYRRFGPTAVVPGLRRLSVVVDPNGEEAAPDHVDIEPPATDAATTTWNNPSPVSIASTHSRLFDKFSNEPHPDMVPIILDQFFKHFGGHFPYLNPQILDGHLRSGEASNFLMNAIAALTARFCSFEGPLATLWDKCDVEWRRGTPYLRKAKEQLVHLLTFPTPDVVAGLLILAWAEFGDNNEAGLWMFAGMAIRMAQDLGLGLDRSQDKDGDKDLSFYDYARPSLDGQYILTDEQSTIHQAKARLVMFWSVFIMDVCVSLVTGRPPTIRRSEIEVPIPTIHDMKLAQLDFSETVSMPNMIFPETVRFMIQFSEAVEALNQRQPGRTSERSIATSSSGSERYETLARIRHSISEEYKSLPSQLVFSIENYRTSTRSGQSGLFLMLHLFFYTFMTLLSSPRSRDVGQGHHHASSTPRTAGNLPRETRTSTPCDIDDAHHPKITAMACQKTVQMLTIAELVDPTGYLATPFINHSLFVAASTILQDAELMEPGTQQSQGSLLTLIASTDYDFLYRKLQDQGRYFGTINSVAAILDHRKRALAGGDNGRGVIQENDETEGGAQRVVGLGDPGIVNRYTIPCL